MFEEFVCLFLELRFFDPERLLAYFPAVADPGAVGAMLVADVNADALFTSTRPEGAADPNAVLRYGKLGAGFGQIPYNIEGRAECAE